MSRFRHYFNFISTKKTQCKIKGKSTNHQIPNKIIIHFLLSMFMICKRWIKKEKKNLSTFSVAQKTRTQRTFTALSRFIFILFSYLKTLFLTFTLVCTISGRHHSTWLVTKQWLGSWQGKCDSNSWLWRQCWRFAHVRLTRW